MKTHDIPEWYYERYPRASANASKQASQRLLRGEQSMVDRLCDCITTLPDVPAGSLVELCNVEDGYYPVDAVVHYAGQPIAYLELKDKSGVHQKSGVSFDRCADVIVKVDKYARLIAWQEHTQLPVWLVWGYRCETLTAYRVNDTIGIDVDFGIVGQANAYGQVYNYADRAEMSLFIKRSAQLCLSGPVSSSRLIEAARQQRDSTADCLEFTSFSNVVTSPEYERYVQTYLPEARELRAARFPNHRYRYRWLRPAKGEHYA